MSESESTTVTNQPSFAEESQITDFNLFTNSDQTLNFNLNLNININNKKLLFTNSTTRRTIRNNNIGLFSKNFPQISSKVGSLDNYFHKPAGGNIIIESRALNWNAQAKVGSLEKLPYVPGGGKNKIEIRKLNWIALPKINSLERVNHQPRGGDIKIENHKLIWNAKPKIGSLERANYKPQGGTIKAVFDLNNVVFVGMDSSLIIDSLLSFLLKLFCSS